MQMTDRMILNLVSKNGYLLKHFPKCDNREIAMAAVKCNGGAIYHCRDRYLYNNRDNDLFLAAIENDGSAYLSVCLYDVMNNREINLCAARTFGLILLSAIDEFLADREIVLAAVKNYGAGLELVSADLRCDREVVLCAVKNNGYALRYASSNLRCDREIVLEAVRNVGGAIRFIGDSKLLELTDACNALLVAAECAIFNLNCTFDNLRCDREIVLEAVQNDGRALLFVNTMLKSDYEVVLTAVKSRGYSLKFANDEFRRNRKIASLAVKQDVEALQFVHTSLRADREIIVDAWHGKDKYTKAHYYEYEYYKKLKDRKCTNTSNARQ